MLRKPFDSLHGASSAATHVTADSTAAAFPAQNSPRVQGGAGLRSLWEYMNQLSAVLLSLSLAAG